MTARRVVTLTCDKDGCRERYVGGEGQPSTQVRTDAKRLSGWRAFHAEGGVHDFCRWHA